MDEKVSAYSGKPRNPPKPKGGGVRTSPWHPMWRGQSRPTLRASRGEDHTVLTRESEGARRQRNRRRNAAARLARRRNRGR